MFARVVDRYRNSTAVVIGGGGIGGAIIKLLSESVRNLVAVDRDDALLEQIKGASNAATVHVRKLDVRNAVAVSEVFAEILSTVGTPDFLFYTAGILNIESFAETTSDQWNTAVNVNLNGAFYCIKAATELMRARRQGSIVVLGSIAGTKARSGSRVNPVYNATKAALSAFVNGAAIQLRRDGVRINCISPGPTETSMMNLQPREVHSAVCDITLDGRMNHPTEVAELALFVAAHGRFTGEELCMGGGAGLGG
jgi:3-oxoacyl-[acyl-carrier protein] reductase